MIYSFENIKNITKEAVIYLDNSNNENKISLTICNENWIDYVNKKIDNFPNRKGIPITKSNTKCVAERNWFAEKPFYSFYTDPQIKFELIINKNFFTKRPTRKCYEKFRSINEKLQGCGWTTFDLG